MAEEEKGENEKEIAALVAVLFDRLTVVFPIADLNKAIEEKNWFKGIVLATILFDLHGRLILKGFYEGKIQRKRFDRLGLEQIIMFLYASNIIARAREETNS